MKGSRMSLFRRGGRSQDPHPDHQSGRAVDTQAPPESTAQGSARVRKPRREATLASVVDETALPAAFDTMASNTVFALPAGTAWAILLLDVTKPPLNGLNLRHRKDPEKGSIVEDIASDRISVVETQSMLADQVLGIIPTPETLATMEGYKLLSGATYVWAVAFHGDQYRGGIAIDTGANTTLADVMRVAGRQISLESALGPDLWATHSGQSAPVLPDSTARPAIEDQRVPPAPLHSVNSPDEIEDLTRTWGDPHADDASGSLRRVLEPGRTDDPDLGDDEALTSTHVRLPKDPSDDAENESGTASEADEEFADDEPRFDDEEETPDFDDEEPVTDPDTEESDGFAGDDEAAEAFAGEPVVADEDSVRSSVVRCFAPEDLDLKVTTDPFVAAFAPTEPEDLLSLPDDLSDWLSQQVTPLVAEGNAALAQLHEQSQTQLRSLYVTLMGTHAEHVVDSVSLAREGGRYTDLMETARANHETQTAQATASIEAARTRISQRYEDEVLAAGKAAAARAEQDYRRRYAGRMEREQVKAAASVTDGIEGAFAGARAKILEARRHDADLQMENGRGKIFEILKEQQSADLAAEHDLLDSWNRRIEAVVEAHRADDISRITALTREQTTIDRVAEITREKELALAELRSRSDAQLAEQKARTEKVRQDSAAALADQETRWRKAMDASNERLGTTSMARDELSAQLEEMETRMTNLQNAHAAELSQIHTNRIEDRQHLEVMQRRSNAVLTVLIVALAIGMLAAGFIIGTYWH